MSVMTKIKQLVTGRDGLLSERAALLEAQRAAGDARAGAIARAQAEVDALDEPRRRLERLQAEAGAASSREANALARLDAQLRENPPREFVQFERLLERAFQLLRGRPVPQAREVYNEITEVRTVENLVEIERALAAARTVTAIRAELASSAWRLPDAALHERLDELKGELEASFRGTHLESEL